MHFFGPETSEERHGTSLPPEPLNCSFSAFLEYLASRPLFCTPVTEQTFIKAYTAASSIQFKLEALPRRFVGLISGSKFQADMA